MTLWPFTALLALALTGTTAQADTYDERPQTLTPVTAHRNYERRVVDIEMRDGTKLHTVIVLPKRAKQAAMLLTRTPYGAEGMTAKTASNDMGMILHGFDNPVDVIQDGGYIRVVQDIRGRFGSGGGFVTNRPLVSSGLNPTQVDESTDAYDTIEWLVKHVPESNGRVGIIGVSYNGFEALMALVNPHPALKVSVPINPMVDGWIGDDWFHNGAFRQWMIPAIWGTASGDSSESFVWPTADAYDAFLRAGSAGELARQHGVEQAGFWRKLTAHPAYDSFWQAQAVDKALAKEPLKVPVMLVHSLWDADDIYGAMAVYRAIKPKDTASDKVYLSIGPWTHGQSIEAGLNIGAIHWGQDTAKWWRQQVLAPFLAHHLNGKPMTVAPVTAFQSGSNEWQRLTRWPAADNRTARLYLKPGLALGFEPAPAPAQDAEYVSDPAKPVPFIDRPLRVNGEGNQWQTWLTGDQRNAASRPDVLVFVSDVLTQPVTVAGQPFVNLKASTTGSDSDWVVKLIDVYPEQIPGEPLMGGYQLPVAMDIFRGRYRESLAKAAPLKPGALLGYRFALPETNHVFQPGHRLMVQVQSSWFPLYDRNPQRFVDNIFFAQPADYIKATQKVRVAGPESSFIELPLTR